jgi:uncharacterized protein YjbJ (UPF0337 family)
LGSLTGEETLISEGQVESLKGQFKETGASVIEIEGEGAATIDTAKPNVNKAGARGQDPAVPRCQGREG